MCFMIYPLHQQQSKDVGTSSMHPKSTFHPKSHTSYHTPKTYVAIPPPLSYKSQKHVTIHLPPSTLPPLLPTPNFPPSIYLHCFQHLIALSFNTLTHLPINPLKILIMTNQCTHCLNMKLPLIPPYPWDSKAKILMPLRIKEKILRALMPSDTKTKNQRKIHLTRNQNLYPQKKKPKLKWFGYLRIKQKKSSQMGHPPLKNPNHPLPPHIPISFENIKFLYPTSKMKIIKILSLCGYLKYFIINHIIYIYIDVHIFSHWLSGFSLGFVFF